MHKVLARTGISERHLVAELLRPHASVATPPYLRLRILYNTSRKPASERPYSATRTLRQKHQPLSTRNADTVRKLMRHVPHPVAIVTASPQDDLGPSTDPRQWRGATVSSFTTVAMDPEPVVCFNIKRDSSTFAALRSSTRFNVHLLTSSAAAETVATKFAGGNALEPFHDGEGNLEWWVEHPRTEDGDHPVLGGGTSESSGGTKDSNIVLFRLACNHMQEKTVEVGDHVVVFGQVRGTSRGSEKEELEPCLLYFHGRYSQAAGR